MHITWISASSLRRQFALLLCILMPAIAMSEENALSVEAGVEKLEKFLEGVETLKAGFHLSLLDPELQVVEESSGTLLIKRPGRFRWDYRDPYEQIVLSDGDRLWMYDSDLEQATVKTLDESLSTTPAMLLSGTGKISESFDVLGVYDAEQIVWVSLKPRANDTDFRTFALGFQGKDLRYMELSDRLDQVTRIEFSNLTRNEKIEDEVFRFEPPAGVDVIGDA